MLLVWGHSVSSSPICLKTAQQHHVLGQNINCSLPSRRLQHSKHFLYVQTFFFFSFSVVLEIKLHKLLSVSLR